jgi:thiol-disulfide isomerase/thioredoxin
MRAKQLSLLLAALLFLLACSLVQSHAPIPTNTASGGVTPGLGVAYELFDESPAPDRFSVVRVGRSKEALTDILRIEARKAADMGRHPYVEFYADWCPPCKAIQENLSDKRMIDAFTGTYIIKLDLDYWKPKLSNTSFDVPGIPAFYEIDTDGNPTGRMITGAAWGEDIPENIAPPMQRFFNGDKSQ